MRPRTGLAGPLISGTETPAMDSRVVPSRMQASGRESANPGAGSPPAAARIQAGHKTPTCSIQDVRHRRDGQQIARRWTGWRHCRAQPGQSMRMRSKGTMAGSVSRRCARRQTIPWSGGRRSKAIFWMSSLTRARRTGGDAVVSAAGHNLCGPTSRVLHVAGGDAARFRQHAHRPAQCRQQPAAPQRHDPAEHQRPRRHRRPSKQRQRIETPRPRRWRRCIASTA